MADKTFPLPDLGEGLIDATVIEWLVKPGDRLERNDPMVEVETTKSALEIPSPLSGIVKTLHAGDGETIEVGKPFVTFEVPDEEAGIVGTVPTEAEPTRRVRLSIPED